MSEMIEVVPGSPAVHFISPSCSFPCFLTYNSKKYSGAKIPVPLLRGPCSFSKQKSFCHSNITFPALNFLFEALWVILSIFFKPNYCCVVAKSDVFHTSMCEMLSAIVSSWYMTSERGGGTEISSKGELNLINPIEIPSSAEWTHSSQVTAAWFLPLLKFWIFI